jgi:hypothetical protein
MDSAMHIDHSFLMEQLALLPACYCYTLISGKQVHRRYHFQNHEEQEVNDANIKTTFYIFNNI